MTQTAAPPAGAVRAIVRTPGWPTWAVATFGARLPVAMAPLALVFAGHAAGGGYALGGILVGVHTLGEAIAAPAAGALVDRWHARRVLAVCLALEAALFLAAAAVVALDGGTALLMVLVALAGAVPAGAPGGLRSLLTHLVGEPVLPRALSLDTVANQICWGLGPVLVSTAAAVGSPVAALALVALPAAVGAGAALGLPDSTVGRAKPQRTAVRRTLRVLSRTLVMTAALRVVLGVLTVAAVPLFTSAGSASFAGFALGAYALGTALGSILYSARRWPGSYERQADVALVVLGVVVTLALVSEHGPVLLALYAVAGVFEGPVVLGRSMHLERLLPPDRRATGFSMQYAAIGWGFAAGSIALAPLLDVAAPGTIIAAAGAVVALLATASFVRPSRHRPAGSAPDPR